MEEAYSELYQQFLHLRSLCLRQTALLHQLTAELRKQQGSTDPHGESSDMISIPVQCTQEIPACLHGKPQPLTGSAHSPAAHCGVDHLSRNVATFSDLLAEDMSKLCMGGPHQRKENHELVQNVAPLLSIESSRWQGASKASKNMFQADCRGDRILHTGRMPVTDSHCMVGDLPSQSEGMLMSDVALQSHTCEFCHAVFPGDTTTRGEFLRHLYTHIT